jgi:sarcosine oxidase subunit alpha
MSASSLEISINGRPVIVTAGASVASTLIDVGELAFRTSETNEPRAPLCGMGICYECRVTIDGVAHRRACMTLVAPGMRIETTSPSHAPLER